MKVPGVITRIKDGVVIESEVFDSSIIVPTANFTVDENWLLSLPEGAKTPVCLDIVQQTVENVSITVVPL